MASPTIPERKSQFFREHMHPYNDRRSAGERYNQNMMQQAIAAGLLSKDQFQALQQEIDALNNQADSLYYKLIAAEHNNEIAYYALASTIAFNLPPNEIHTLFECFQTNPRPDAIAPSMAGLIHIGASSEDVNNILSNISLDSNVLSADDPRDNPVMHYVMRYMYSSPKMHEDAKTIATEGQNLQNYSEDYYKASPLPTPDTHAVAQALSEYHRRTSLMFHSFDAGLKLADSQQKYPEYVEGLYSYMEEQTSRPLAESQQILLIGTWLSDYIPNATDAIALAQTIMQVDRDAKKARHASYRPMRESIEEYVTLETAKLLDLMRRIDVADPEIDTLKQNFLSLLIKTVAKEIQDGRASKMPNRDKDQYDLLLSDYVENVTLAYYKCFQQDPELLRRMAWTRDPEVFNKYHQNISLTAMLLNRGIPLQKIHEIGSALPEYNFAKPSIPSYEEACYLFAAIAKDNPTALCDTRLKDVLLAPFDTSEAIQTLVYRPYSAPRTAWAQLFNGYDNKISRENHAHASVKEYGLWLSQLYRQTPALFTLTEEISQKLRRGAEQALVREDRIGTRLSEDKDFTKMTDIQFVNSLALFTAMQVYDVAKATGHTLEEAKQCMNAFINVCRKSYPDTTKLREIFQTCEYLCLRLNDNLVSKIDKNYKKEIMCEKQNLLQTTLWHMFSNMDKLPQEYFQAINQFVLQKTDAHTLKQDIFIDPIALYITTAAADRDLSSHALSLPRSIYQTLEHTSKKTENLEQDRTWRGQRNLRWVEKQLVSAAEVYARDADIQVQIEQVIQALPSTTKVQVQQEISDINDRAGIEPQKEQAKPEKIPEPATPIQRTLAHVAIASTIRQLAKDLPENNQAKDELQTIATLYDKAEALINDAVVNQYQESVAQLQNLLKETEQDNDLRQTLSLAATNHDSAVETCFRAYALKLAQAIDDAQRTFEADLHRDAKIMVTQTANEIDLGLAFDKPKVVDIQYEERFMSTNAPSPTRQAFEAWIQDMKPIIETYQQAVQTLASDPFSITAVDNFRASLSECVAAFDETRNTFKEKQAGLDMIEYSELYAAMDPNIKTFVEAMRGELEKSHVIKNPQRDANAQSLED